MTGGNLWAADEGLSVRLIAVRKSVSMFCAPSQAKTAGPRPA